LSLNLSLWIYFGALSHGTSARQDLHSASLGFDEGHLAKGVIHILTAGQMPGRFDLNL